MPDVHSVIITVDRGDLDLADGARLLEIGCGTGAIARVLAASPGVGEVLGVDPSPIMLTRARALTRHDGAALSAFARHSSASSP